MARAKRRPNEQGEWLCTKTRHWVPLSGFYVDPLIPDRPRTSWCKDHLRTHQRQYQQGIQERRIAAAIEGLLGVSTVDDWEDLSPDVRQTRLLGVTTEQRHRLEQLGFLSPAETEAA